MCTMLQPFRRRVAEAQRQQDERERQMRVMQERVAEAARRKVLELDTKPQRGI